MKRSLYSGRDLNPHDRNGQGILSPSCLPIPPPERNVKISQTFVLTVKTKNPSTSGRELSERRDSNPRPRPWQGRALPAELLSQGATKVAKKSNHQNKNELSLCANVLFNFIQFQEGFYGG